jgi:hypothetical protein
MGDLTDGRSASEGSMRWRAVEKHLAAGRMRAAVLKIIGQDRAYLGQ